MFLFISRQSHFSANTNWLPSLIYAPLSRSRVVIGHPRQPIPVRSLPTHHRHRLWVPHLCLCSNNRLREVRLRRPLLPAILTLHPCGIGGALCTMFEVRPTQHVGQFACFLLLSRDWVAFDERIITVVFVFAANQCLYSMGLYTLNCVLFNLFVFINNLLNCFYSHLNNCVHCLRCLQITVGNYIY